MGRYRILLHQSSLFWCHCLSRFLGTKGLESACARGLIRRRLLPDVCNYYVSRNALVSVARRVLLVAIRDLPIKRLGFSDTEEIKCRNAEFGIVTLFSITDIFILRQRSCDGRAILERPVKINSEQFDPWEVRITSQKLGLKCATPTTPPFKMTNELNNSKGTENIDSTLR